MDSALYVLVKAYHSNNYILQRGYTLCIKKKKKINSKAGHKLVWCKSREEQKQMFKPAEQRD